MPNARHLDATDLAALLPAAEAVSVLQAALTAGDPGATWAPDATAGGRAPAGTAALLRGGAPELLVDAASFAARRDAAAALLVARHLADPRLEVITILGCNATGRAVMELAVKAFTGLERMLCYDPDVAAQAAFADEIMTTHSVASIIPPEAREAVEGAQLLVSCLQPALPKPVVEPDWLQAGTTCVLLDGLATFTPATLAAAARRVTDSLPAWRAAAAAGHLPGVSEPEGDLAALAAGNLAARSGQPLVVSVHLGAPALDAALAVQLAARAAAAGRGRTAAT
jgi:ornithine cyclodeaminase